MTPLQNLARALALTSALAAALLPLNACRQSSFPDYPAGYREFAYIANRSADTVTILDLVYLRPDRTLSVGVAPSALAVNPQKNEVYVVNAQPQSSAGSLSVIDTTSNSIVATIPLHRDPTAIVVDPAGHRAYITNTGSNTVSVIDLDIRRQIAAYVTGDHPNALAIAPDNRTLVVANGASGTISIFAVGDPTTVAPPLARRATFGDCPGATSPVILPDSTKTFIACPASNRVLALQLAAAPGSWPAQQDASQLTDHAIALLDVGKNPTNLTLKPDGGEIFVSNQGSDSISELSTQTNDVGNTYPIGNRPAHGIVSSDNSALFVSNSGADTLSLYSITDGKLISGLRTGNAPDALAFSADEHLLLAADTLSGDIALIRTASRLGPALFTILPAGSDPVAIVTKAMPPKP